MSTAADLETAVAAAVTALAFTGVTVKIRKRPIVSEGDTLPIAVVSVAEEGDFEYMTARKKIVTYPCAVTFVTKQGTAAVDSTTLRAWREAVGKKMEAAATFSGVTGFNKVSAGGKEPYDPAALAKDLNYSSLLYRCEVIEDTR